MVAGGEDPHFHTLGVLDACITEQNDESSPFPWQVRTAPGARGLESSSHLPGANIISVEVVFYHDISVHRDRSGDSRRTWALAVNDVRRREAQDRRATMAPRSDEAAAFFNAVYSAVQEIPPGKVTSYGHIARLVGARTCGLALPGAQTPQQGRFD
jgi:hypothetical protein